MKSRSVYRGLWPEREPPALPLFPYADDHIWRFVALVKMREMVFLCVFAPLRHVGVDPRGRERRVEIYFPVINIRSDEFDGRSEVFCG